METTSLPIPNSGLSREELLAELAHVRHLLAEAEAKTRLQWELIDKITAASLRTDNLLRKLEEQR